MPQTLESMTMGDKLICLFKGDPGTGKTIAAASFSNGEDDIYFFDLDQRMRPLLLHYGHPDLVKISRTTSSSTPTQEQRRGRTSAQSWTH